MFTFYFKRVAIPSLATAAVTTTIKALSSVIKCDSSFSSESHELYNLNFNSFSTSTVVMASSQPSAPYRIKYFRGSLVGALIGDCIGAEYEGRWPVNAESVKKHLRQIEKDFVLTSDTRKSGKQAPCLPYTDDTAMLRSIAESLIELEKFDAKDIANRFAESYHNEPWRGYGGGVIAVFRKLKEQNCKDPFHPASEQFGGSGSYGNGGAMRIAPAALFTDTKSEKELMRLTKDLTRITHTHRDGILGAQFESLAVRYALEHSKQAVSSPDIKAFTKRFLDRLEEAMKLEGSEEKPEREKEDEADGATSSKKLGHEKAGTAKDRKGPYVGKIDVMRDLLDVNEKTTHNVDIADVVEKLGNDIAALDSVPLAVYCFLRSLRPIDNLLIPEEYHPFCRCIMLAICMGGDTDTIASMAGAIAGAYHGIDVIPETWQRACEGLQEAIAMADELYQISHPPPATSPETSV